MPGYNTPVDPIGNIDWSTRRSHQQGVAIGFEAASERLFPLNRCEHRRPAEPRAGCLGFHGELSQHGVDLATVERPHGTLILRCGWRWWIGAFLHWPWLLVS